MSPHQAAPVAFRDDVAGYLVTVLVSEPRQGCGSIPPPHA